jgi:hypothetical protein
VAKSKTKVDLARFSVLLAVAACIVLKRAVMRKAAVDQKILRCSWDWLLVNVV